MVDLSRTAQFDIPIMQFVIIVRLNKNDLTLVGEVNHVSVVGIEVLTAKPDSNESFALNSIAEFRNDLQIKHTEGPGARAQLPEARVWCSRRPFHTQPGPPWPRSKF